MDALLYASTETLCSVSISSASYAEGYALYIVYTAAILVGIILGFLHFMALLTSNRKRQTIILVSLCITLIWGLNIILLVHGHESCTYSMERIVQYLRLYSFDVWMNWKQVSSCTVTVSSWFPWFSSLVSFLGWGSSSNSKHYGHDSTTIPTHTNHTGLDQDILSPLTCTALSSVWELFHHHHPSTDSSSPSSSTFLNNIFVTSLTRSEAIILTGMILSTILHTLSSYNFMPGSTLLVWLARHWLNLLTGSIVYLAIFFATSDDILVTLPILIQSFIPSRTLLFSIGFQVWNIMSTYILRADLAAILGLSSLISQILPEAGYIVAYNGIDKIITLIIFSTTLFYTVWRYQRIIQCMQARGLKAWTVLAEKSLVILCVQWWTDLPVHAPILFTLTIVLDADLTERISKATQRSAFQWLQYLMLLFCRTRKNDKTTEETEYDQYAHRVYNETKGNSERTKDVAWICAPRFQRRFHRVGVTTITIMTFLGLFWSLKLIFSGFGGYGIDMHTYSGKTNPIYVTRNSRKDNPKDFSDTVQNSPMDTCIAVPHVGGAWGVYSSLSDEKGKPNATNYHGVPYPNTIFRVIGGLHSTFSQGVSLLLFGPFSYDPSLMCSHPNRKSDPSETPSSSAGTKFTANTGCLMASYVMGMSSLIIIPIVTVVGMVLSTIVYGLSFVDSLFGTSFLVSSSSWQEGLSVPVYFHDLTPFRRGPSNVLAAYTGYPVPYTLLDGILETERLFTPSLSSTGTSNMNYHQNGGALQSWWIIQSILGLAGMHLLLYGPPAEGLQRTLRKMFSENKYVQKGNRTVQREKEQAEAYMDDDNGDIGQELPLVIPAFITAPLFLSIAIWLIWTVITGEPPLGVFATTKEPHHVSTLFASSLLNAIPDVLPSPLLGIVMLGFVFTCLLPRHRSNEVLRGTIALNHTIVGALLLLIALFMMRVDMRPFSVVVPLPDNTVNPYAWHLCTRMYFHSPSSLFIASVFSLLVSFGTLWKIFTFSSQLRQATDNLRQFDYDLMDSLYIYDEDTDQYIWTMMDHLKDETIVDETEDETNTSQDKTYPSYHASSMASGTGLTPEPSSLSSTAVTSGRKRAGSVSDASRNTVQSAYYNVESSQIGNDIDSMVARLTTSQNTVSSISSTSRYEADRRAYEDALQYMKLSNISGSSTGMSRGGGGGGGGFGGGGTGMGSSGNSSETVSASNGGRSFIDIDHGYSQSSSLSSFPSSRRTSVPHNTVNDNRSSFPQSSPVTSTSQYTLPRRPPTDATGTDNNGNNQRTSVSYGLPQQLRTSLGSNKGVTNGLSTTTLTTAENHPNRTNAPPEPRSRSRSRSISGNYRKPSIPVNYTSSIVPTSTTSIGNQLSSQYGTNTEAIDDATVPMVGSKRRTMDDDDGGDDKHDGRLQREEIDQLPPEDYEYTEEDYTTNEWGGGDIQNVAHLPSSLSLSSSTQATNTIPSSTSTTTVPSYNRFAFGRPTPLGSVLARGVTASQPPSSYPRSSVSQGIAEPFSRYPPPSSASRSNMNSTTGGTQSNTGNTPTATNANIAAVTSHDASIYFKRFKMVDTFSDPD